MRRSGFPFFRPPVPPSVIRPSVRLSFALLAATALLLPASHAEAPAAAPAPAPAASPAPAPAALPSRGAAAGGLVTIESDSQQADNRTGVVTAIGNVRITYPPRGVVATARQAQYYTREGRLILSGDVQVVDAEGQRIRAERLVYLLDSERLSAQPTPGSQVVTRLRLQMQPSKPAPNR